MRYVASMDDVRFMLSRQLGVPLSKLEKMTVEECAEWLRFMGSRAEARWNPGALAAFTIGVAFGAGLVTLFVLIAFGGR